MECNTTEKYQAKEKKKKSWNILTGVHAMFSNIKWMYMTISSGFALEKYRTGCQSSYPMMQ